MVKILIGGVLLLSLISSCSSNRKNDEATPKVSEAIEVSFVDRPLKGSQILKGSRVISLSSKHDEALIAKVDRLLIGNDRYFVMDRRGNKLIAFNGQGEYIASTTPYIGEGPNSYIRIIDAVIDNEAKKIYAHCDAPYCIMVFDMNLKLQEKISLDFYMLEVADDNRYIYGIRTRNASGFGYELVALDKYNLSASPVVLLENTNVVYGAMAIGKSLTSSAFGVNVCLPFDNVVYQIKDKAVIARYPLDFGDKGVLYSDIKEMSANEFYDSSYREKIWSVVNVYSSDSILFFGCNRVYSFILNRSSEACVGFPAWRNDLMPYSVTQTLPVDGLGNAYAYLWPSSHVMDFKSHVSEEQLDEDMKKALRGYEEEDNPLLILCEMK